MLSCWPAGLAGLAQLAFFSSSYSAFSLFRHKPTKISSFEGNMFEGILNYKFLGDKHRNIGFLNCQRCKM